MGIPAIHPTALLKALDALETEALKGLQELAPPSGAPNAGLVGGHDAERVVLKLVSQLRVLVTNVMNERRDESDAVCGVAPAFPSFRSNEFAPPED